MSPTVHARILACLQGLAIGDAIGKQTETLPHEDVRHCYPDGVRGFEGPPGATIPRYVGNSKREWRIGETTDDTEMTMAVARAILQDPDHHVRHVNVGRELLTCTKSLHPGVKSLWEFHQAGDPARVARRHDGCGAAVRVAPVGILYRSDRLDEIVAAAREASIPTHGGVLAIAAAAATAAAVSSAIDEASPREIAATAQRAAALVERQYSSAGGSAESAVTPFAEAVRTIHEDLRELHSLNALDAAAAAARSFPDRPLTIVPLAIALATVLDSAEAAILLATNVGGDSDSVAAIAGAILGARCPETVNAQWSAIVEQVNGHDLSSLAPDLTGLRR